MFISGPKVLSTNTILVDEDRSMVAALPNGGYVVAWQEIGDGNQSIHMQTFHADGTAISADVVVAETNPGIGFDETTLRDLFVTPGGQIAVAYQTDDFGIALTTAANAGLSGLTTIPATSAFTVSSAQIISAGSSPTDVTLFVADSSTIYEMTVNAATGALLSPLNVGIGWGGQTLDEGLSRSFLVTALGALDLADDLISAASDLRDAAVVAPGLVLAIATGNFGETVPYLLTYRPNGADSEAPTAIGTDGALLGYDFGTPAPAVGSGIRDAQVAALGNGRALIVWSVDFGDDFQFYEDGVYAQVVNLATGRAEGFAELVFGLGSGPNGSVVTDAKPRIDVLTDGRVIVSMDRTTLLTGSDVMTAMIDARVGAISVTGSASADRYFGTEENDTFTGADAGDSLFGGDGDDTVVFTGTVGRRVDLSVPGAFLGSSLVFDSIENLTGGGGADQFYGNDGANTFRGAAGNDLLLGRDGADYLDGGSGDDTVLGGNLWDTLFGGSENDLMRGGDDSDEVHGGTGNDTLHGGDGDDNLHGGSGNDFLNGGEGRDLIDGGDGDDTLIGNESWDDTLLGGAGNDRLVIGYRTDLVDGGTGSDTVVADEEEGGIALDLSGLYDFLGYDGSDFEAFGPLAGIEHLTGSGSADFLIGNGGANQLRGRGGADTLVGGGGADTLIGGQGEDHFVFMGAGSGADTVTGFRVGQDKIALSSEAFAQLEAVGLATRLVISATAAPAAFAAPQLLFDNSGAGAGQLFYDADGNGATAAILLATITFSPQGGLTTFGATDFVFI